MIEHGGHILDELKREGSNLISIQRQAVRAGWGLALPLLRETIGTRKMSPVLRGIVALEEEENVLMDLIGSSIEKGECKAGCYFCCAIPVAVNPMQVFRIAKILSPASSRKVRGRGDGLVGVSRGDQAKKNDLCPLLENGMCSIYPWRPMNCRSMYSLDVATCLRIFEGSQEDVPMNGTVRVLIDALDLGYMAAWWVAGYDAMPVELVRGLTLVQKPDVEKQWLARKTVFSEARDGFLSEEEWKEYGDIMIQIRDFLQ